MDDYLIDPCEIIFPDIEDIPPVDGVVQSILESQADEEELVEPIPQKYINVKGNSPFLLANTLKYQRGL